MRLGSYRAQVKPDSRIAKLYKSMDRLEEGNTVVERHRHRYEVNNTFVERLEKAGLVFSGYYDREDGTRLMEFIELPQHPYFVATQAHPEFTSRVGSPNPLFVGLIDAARTRMHARKTA
jgi:CTP synthase